MKKIANLLVCAFLVVTSLASCRNEEVPGYSISVDPAELTFGYEGGEETVSVTSTADWELSGDSFWCHASSYSGKGDAEVIFTADPNEDAEAGRSATFTFVSGDRKATLTVTQGKTEYSVSIEPKELKFNAEGGKQTVEVTSSHKWTLTNDSSWITTSADKGESGSLVEISAGHNTSADIKSGEIIFTCGDKTAVLKVSQEIDGTRTIQFKDPNFLEALIAENVDADGDGQISFDEAKAVKSLDVSNSDIKEMSEIRYFTALTYLYCRNNQLTTLDVSNNTALTSLSCYGNQLTALDVSSNTALEDLYCYDNQLTALDVSNNTALTYLYCYGNQLTALDVSSNTALTYLSCGGNRLTALDVSSNTALTSLSCYVNQLTALDVSSNTALEDLNCGGNRLTALDVSSNTALTSLSCDDNQLTALDVSSNTALEDLYCYGNQLTALDVSSNTALEYLYCYDNQLTALDVSSNTALTSLSCYDNQLTALDVSSNTALESLYCSGNPLQAITISESQRNASWMNDVKQDYPDIEIIVK